MITPPFIAPGDKIGIVAPARSISREELRPFAELMTQKGYKLKYGARLFGTYGQYSGSVQERAEDLMSMLTDRSVKAVFAARGGYGAAQLLPFLDERTIRENPKWMVGFSDVCAVHALLNHQVESIHGFMPYSLIMEEPQTETSFEMLLRALQGEDLVYPVEDHALNISGKVKGRLIGGNLSVLFSLAGTSYEPDYKGAILFLEDLDEYLYHIDRMILNFELRGIFQELGGLVIGSFSDMHDNAKPFGKNACEIIAERAEKYNIPCLFAFPAGHKKNNLPLIFGRVSTLTVKEGASFLKMF